MAKGDGIKYDAAKPRLAEMICDFSEPLLEVCKVWEFGANKYGKSNWKDLDNGADRYTNALLRHVVTDSPMDDESGLLHAAHAAFNALARLKFIKDDLIAQHFYDVTYTGEEPDADEL